MATEILRPNAAGDEESIDFVVGDGEGSHYAAVDEETADDDTSYVANKESTSYQRDLYNLPASSGSGTINKITIYFRCAANFGGPRAKPSLKSNTTVTDGTEVKLNGGWTTYSEEWATNPADGAAWEWADIDALQIGVSLKRGFVSTWWGKCTQVYVEVDYTLPFIGLAGVSAGAATVSGLAVVTYKLAGAVSGVASVSGATSILRTLAGLSSGIASTTASLTVAITQWLAGLSSGVCSVVADLTNVKWLAGVTTGVCSTTGTTAITRGLAGVAAGVCSVSANLVNIKWLKGLIAGAATVTGDLFHVRTAVRVLSAVRNLLAVRNIPPVR